MSMKLKYWLVVLLALILPLKGTMAAVGMLCHVPASQQAHAAHDHAPHHDHRASAPQGASHHEASRADADGSQVTTCCLACGAVCGATPIPATLTLSLPVFQPLRDWRGVVPITPPVGVLAGLERPPRRI